MTDTNKQTIIGGFDYERTFGFARIFRSFKIATQPGKLALALFMIVFMFVVGLLADGIFGGGRVYVNEFQKYVTRRDNETFESWRKLQAEGVKSYIATFLRIRLNMDFDAADKIAGDAKCWSLARKAVNEHFNNKIAKLNESGADSSDKQYQTMRQMWDESRAATLSALNENAPRSVFSAVVDIKLNAFQSLINAAKSIGTTGWAAAIGWDQLDPTISANDRSIIGSIRMVVYEMPRWLWATHPLFLTLWGIFFVGVWSLLGGAISRMTIVESATGESVSIPDAVGFAYRHWLAYALAPLIPLFFVGLIMLVMALAGLLFHLPVLNIIGALLLVIAIPAGFVMAFFLIGYVGSVNLMYPAVSAEGTDAFDAVTRSYTYVITRPWRFITYTALMLAYGVVTYLFVGLFIFLALYIVQSTLATWASPVEQVFHKPILGHLRYDFAGEGLGGTAKIAALLIYVFVMLTVGLLAAYAISYYFSAYSAIYLLLRGRADGTDPSEVFVEPPQSPKPAAPAAPIPAAGMPAPASPGTAHAASSEAAAATPVEAPEKAPDAVEADNA